jgi:hypothetical protein
MKTQQKILVVALALLLAALNSQHATCLAQGSLTPPGAPAPTMKSLDQIEARTPISSAPFTITQPGSYYLTTNVTVSSGDAIIIATNGVTLDLNGFIINSTAASAAGTGILLNSGLRNVTIANGFIQGGVTNDGSGVYSGSGFGYGIYYSGFSLMNVRVSGLSVSGCLYSGIYLNPSDSTAVESCSVRTVGSAGIFASSIKTSCAIDCGSYGIYGYQVSDCRGESTGSSGNGVYANSSALNCYGYNVNGNAVVATSALNCYGVSSGSGAGIIATTAQNCYGYSNNGTGVDAYSMALNCYAHGSNGSGLHADLALNCYGETSGSFPGVSVRIAQNCYGHVGGGGYGVYASSTAISCYGYSFSGTGLYAFIANVCSGTSISTVHDVNSF